MQSILVKSAIAGALALAGTSAWALAPTTTNINNAVVLRISGATATDNTLQNLFKIRVNGPCVAGTLDIYQKLSSSGSLRQYMAFCEANPATTGYAAGTPIAVIKEVRGGSANGILFPGQGSLLFLDFTFANLSGFCNTVTTNVPQSADGVFAQHNIRTCGGNGSAVAEVNAVPHAGVSDVDPQTFVGTAGVTQANVSSLDPPFPGVGIIFGPIVSEPLYRRLQTLQGLPTNDAFSSMPSLPSTVLRGIANGQIENWNEVYINGQLVSSNATAYVCRRVETSGTQTSFEIQLLGENCQKTPDGTSSFVGPDDSNCLNNECAWLAGTYGNHRVFAGSGSGDVRNCMAHHAGLGRYAVGTASTESKPSGVTWRYVKVDGQEPTVPAAASGRYDFVMESTLNQPAGGLTGANAGIWQYIIDNIGSATAAAKTNESFQNAAGISTVVGSAEDDGRSDTGVLVIPDLFNPAKQPTLPITNANARSNPVNGNSRTIPFSVTNNCNRQFSVIP